MIHILQETHSLTSHRRTHWCQVADSLVSHQRETQGSRPNITSQNKKIVVLLTHCDFFFFYTLSYV